MNELNKPKCFVKLGLKGLQLTNTVVYLKKMKCGEHIPRGCIQSTSFSS